MKITLNLFLIVTFLSCSKYPEKVNIALKSAEKNRDELSKVLEHYSHNKGDSLKLKAAFFLIENMLGSNYQNRTFWVDKTGMQTEFNPFSFVDKKTALNAIDSVEKKLGYQRINQVSPDLFSVTHKYLVENIDLAFTAWQNSPWKSQIGFETFCEYILPYRVQSEPLSNCKELLYKKFLGVMDSMHGNNLSKACVILNNELRKEYRYSSIALITNKNQSIPEIMESKKGSCTDLTTLSAGYMRSVGIPIGIDFTTWAHTYGGHTWNVLIDGSKKAKHFGGAEESLGEHKVERLYKSHYRMAKVYRKTFSVGKWLTFSTSCKYSNRF